MVKRRDLERHLRAHGSRVLREGGSHTIWISPAGARVAIPRHREIPRATARRICEAAGVPPMP